MDLQKGDILLKKGTAIGAVLIRELTADGVKYKNSYSHCGIYAGEIDGVKKLYDCRFPKAGLHELDYEYFDVYRVNLSDEEKDKLFEYCANHQVDYALEALAEEGIVELFHIPIQVNLHHQEWCAIYVNLAFKQVGKLLTNKPYPFPNDIAWSVLCQKVE